MLTRLLRRLSTRKCNGCDDKSFHTHHLTRLGRHRYIAKFQNKISEK